MALAVLTTSSLQPPAANRLGGAVAGAPALFLDDEGLPYGPQCRIRQAGFGRGRRLRQGGRAGRYGDKDRFTLPRNSAKAAGGRRSVEAAHGMRVIRFPCLSAPISRFPVLIPPLTRA
jgi:hypothetical protein